MHRGRTLMVVHALVKKSWGKDSEKVAGPIDCRDLRLKGYLELRASGSN